MTGVAQETLIAQLDTFFQVSEYDESPLRDRLPREYLPILTRFARPEFINGPWNGLLFNEAKTIDRVYLIVVPTQTALDTILAREVQRSGLGALIVAHHICEQREDSGAFAPIPSAQIEELQEHRISYYVCHEPLDRHPTLNSSRALAEALKLREIANFPSGGRPVGAHGQIGTLGFNDLAKRAAEVSDLPILRYNAIRNNGALVQHVGAIAGIGGIDDLRAAIAAGVDTVVTGEWWPAGPNTVQTTRRTAIHDFLQAVDLNLIGTARYASESCVMRDWLPDWVRERFPGLETQFVPHA